ncbi:MAG: exodeoxyribonuclease VII small subunit [Bacteroidaceae bacterium]|jgi:exodeoxyribonuclease VII small subunit|nr:exodeoxyribonuclease VII small subunit [Bacteroidaceae bacterium]
MEKLTYTQAIVRLQEIMTNIENGKIDIDGLQDTLNEANELITFCRTKLHKVDEEIKTILDNISAE